MFVSKKKISYGLLLILPLVAALMITSVKSTNTIEFDIVEPTPAEVNVGEQITVQVTISNVEETHDLVGVEFEIRWNTSLLQGVRMDLPTGHFMQDAADDGNLWIIKKKVDDATKPDTAWYLVTCSDLAAGYSNGYLPFVGSGVLATITFEGVSIDGSDITFDVIKLSDGLGGHIYDYTSTNGHIDVIPEFPMHMLPIILLIMSIIAIAFRKGLPGSKSSSTNIQKLNQ